MYIHIEYYPRPAPRSRIGQVSQLGGNKSKSDRAHDLHAKSGIAHCYMDIAKDRGVWRG